MTPPDTTGDGWRRTTSSARLLRPGDIIRRTDHDWTTYQTITTVTPTNRHKIRITTAETTKPQLLEPTHRLHIDRYNPTDDHPPTPTETGHHP